MMRALLSLSVAGLLSTTLACRGSLGEAEAPTVDDSAVNESTDGGATELSDAGASLSLDAGARDAGGTTVDAGRFERDAGPGRSSGCGLSAAAGTVTRHLTVSGIDRTFTVVIPAGYDPNIAHSMIFRFHGFGATGAEAVGGIGLNVPPIMVGPDTNPPTGNTTAWNTSADLLLVDAIVAALSSELCINPTYNFVTGYSNGGFMADAVGCHRSAVFRGVAIQESGSSFGSMCGRNALYIQHNADDMTVPISYGTQLRDRWLGINGCSMTLSTPVSPSPCVSYAGCAQGYPVVWCSPPTGGHRPNYDVAVGISAFFKSL